MNIFWKWAFDTPGETVVYRAILLGFAVGYLKADWVTGVVYAFIAPFAAIPFLFALVLLGSIVEIWPRKTHY